MSLLRGTVFSFILKLILFQVVSSEIIQFIDGEITYEYDNEATPLGAGGFGTVFKGARRVENETEIVAFKEEPKGSFFEKLQHLKSEKELYERIGSHDSLPKVYYYSPPSSRNNGVLVMELIGTNLGTLHEKFGPFSTVTVMRIGLQVLDLFEYTFNKGVNYADVGRNNMAVGLENTSKIYLLDFGESKTFTLIRGKPSRKIMHVWHLAQLLAMMKDKTGKYVHTGEELDDEDCKETFINFIQKGKKIYEDGDKPDYEAVRKILRTELEKHKNEPNYEKFDWQITQADKNETT